MVAVSARTGTFLRINVSDVSRDAAISGNAAFFAPPIGMTPSSGTPPLMQILSMASVPRVAHRPERLRGGQLAVLPPLALLVLESEAPLKPSEVRRCPAAPSMAGARAAPAHVPAPCVAANCRAMPLPAAPLAPRA